VKDTCGGRFSIPDRVYRGAAVASPQDQPVAGSGIVTLPIFCYASTRYVSTSRRAQVLVDNGQA
jgi:hypothetical protein